MTIQDWFQTISLLGVALALLLNTRQIREMGSQTRSMLRSLEQNAYQQQLRTHSDHRILFFKDDPRLLSWHLGTRGYTLARSHQRNKRTLYALVKLDEHEANYLSYTGALLPEEVWLAWLEVIRADFGVKEFQDVWHNAKRFYVTSFVKYVDTSILARPE
ncbi:MAG TPA: hypothetical protein VGL63_02190 [Streptosporangiaceae bacterium]|jgi:hypothetical protein